MKIESENEQEKSAISFKQRWVKYGAYYSKFVLEALANGALVAVSGHIVGRSLGRRGIRVADVTSIKKAL